MERLDVDDNGSDTETDDEMFERFEALKKGQAPTPDARASDHVSRVAREHPETVNGRGEDGPTLAADTPAARDHAAAADRVHVKKHGEDVVPSVTTRSPSTVPLEMPTVIVAPASVENESVQPPHKERRDDVAASTGVSAPGNEQVQPPKIPEVLSPMVESAPLSQASAHEEVETTAQLTALKSEKPVEPPTPPTPTQPAVPSSPPPATAPPVLIPATPGSGRFVSPFSALATTYQLPPAPVYGAPPTSYVPGRGPVAPPSLPHQVVKIPCSNCERTLPLHSSPVPLEGHGSCACCGRYYPRVVSRKDGRPERYCTTCVTAPGPRVPTAVTSTTVLLHQVVKIPCSTCKRTLPFHSSPIPLEGHGSCACCGRYYPHVVSRKDGRADHYCTTCVTSQGPRVSTVVVSTSVPPPTVHTNTKKCPVCKQTVIIVPPTAEDRLECQCCNNVMTKNAFGIKQRRHTHPMPRCKSCVSVQPTPAKFKNIRSKSKKAVGDTSVLTSRERRRAKRYRAATQEEEAAIQPPSASAQFTMEERLEMERQVGKIKVEKRSIQRRRNSNDLRGSTRLEYEAQLHEEELKLIAKEHKLRARNPVLFEETNQSVKVKIAQGVPSGERDGAGKKKKVKSHKAAPKAKSPTAAKQPKQPKKSATSAKRKASDAASGTSTQSTAKRARTTPKPATISPGDSLLAQKTETTTVKQPAKSKNNTKASPKKEPSSSVESARAITTRARTRAARPVEIIDLVDSD